MFDHVLPRGFRCPQGVKPFELNARLIPVAGDPSDLPDPAPRVHAYMMAVYERTGEPLTSREIHRALGRYVQLHGDSPWYWRLDCWPLEHLYDASLLYEEPASEVQP
ncbi:hypothetical protein PEp14_00050 [Erwinia phage PEp14]|uniref:Uncharacterized protein n=1 Tax=Erwinia phage PEp14 TaxID=1131315 RepID=H2DE80_9CAUD|nr:hypothetical protein PEp14_00050 [Erwinia phage PEp14]AEY69639.1 hypothetical protein PEp14_00050 [Erwinia phage PEp14]